MTARSPDAPSRYVARVYRENVLTGAGFLLESDLLLTCAHVVAGGSAATEALQPRTSIEIDLPSSGSKDRYSGTIIGWAPLRLDAIGTPGDMAVVQLDREIPEFIPPPLLVSSAITGDPFRVIGFPALYDSGVEATGAIGQLLPNGWIQLDAEKVPGYPLAEGFSGAPVWDERAGAFVGVLSMAERDRSIKSGRMIPAGDFAKLSDRVVQGAWSGFCALWRQWEMARRGELTASHALATSDAGSYARLWWQMYESQKPWHEEVESEIETARNAIHSLSLDSLRGFVEELSSIDLRAPYPEIAVRLTAATRDSVFTELAALIEREPRRPHAVGSAIYEESERLIALRKLLRHVRALSRFARHPQFHRCFLLTGTFGSGKTHFCTTLLRATVDNAESGDLHLPIDVSTVLDLDTAILAAVNAAAGVRFRSLQEMDAHVEAIHASFARPRIQVHLDDLHVAARADRNFISKLTKFIDDHTAIHSLYYLITIQDAHYDRVAASAGFWLRHTFVDLEPKRSRWGPPLAEDPPHIAGWIVLDDANRLGGTGLAILRSAIGADVSRPLPFEHSPEAKRIIAALSHPLTAAIMAELYGQITLETASLNFLEFVKLFWNRRKVTLDPRPLDERQVEEVVQLLAAAIAETGEETPRLNTLLPAAAALSGGVLGIHWNPELIRSGIDVIEHAGLARVEADSQSDLFSRRLRLLFETFWSYSIAVALAEEIDHLSDAAAVRDAVETWFARRELWLLGESILEFLILILARDDDLLLDRSLAVAKWALVGPRAASAWFAGARLDSQRQRAFLTAASTFVPEPRPTFAFLIFIRNGELEPEESLRLLQRLYPAIGKHALTSYFTYLFDHLLAQVESLEELGRCLLWMNGCEAMGTPEAFAAIAVRRLFNLARASADRSIESLIRDYLRPLSLHPPTNRQKAAGPWTRSYFSEWMVHVLLAQLGGRLKVNGLYDLLMRHGWYDSRALGIRYPVSLDMQREANIILGSEYRRRDAGEKDAVQFVKKLSQLIDGDLQDREVAFFILRHTQPPGDVRLGSELRPLLARLAADPRLVARVARFRNVFEETLGPQFATAVLRDSDDRRRPRRRKRHRPDR